MVLVIDEFSSIARADFEGIYNLLRAREVHGVSIPTVLVSLDNPPLVYFKESEIRSIGNVESLKFLRYGVGELRDIVSDRVDRAITPGACSDEVIDYIADISEQYGSARVAIEVLQKSAYIAEYRQSAEIGIDDVRAAKSMINPYITESKLASLMEEDLVVLLAVCRCLVSSRYCESSCIMQEVSVIAEDFLGSPMPASRASGVLRKLETVGLVDSRVIGQPGDSRKVYGISEVPVSVLSRKIISMLGKKQ
ncbi:AAA family ATPase [Thermogymnomonas acidicola]|uniref:Cdc6/Cdc18 family protein n=1 Tax=Thermogymnomonas acidicola TaxID=399579 RepID=UPI001396CE2F|nr:AAA family ATPase [Thermogymnomonas acidicola]